MTKQPSSTPKITTKKHIARLERERRQVALVRTISIVAIALVVILVGYGILDTTYIKLNKPVAEVNSEQISLGYWQERVQMYRLNLMNTLQQYQYYQQAFGMDTSQQVQQITAQLQSDLFLGEEVLNQLVDETLIRQEAEKRGITVTDAEVDEKIQGAFSFYPNGTPIPTTTPTEFSYPTLTSEQLTLYPPTSIPTEVLTATPAPTNTPDAAVTATPTVAATPTFLPQPPTATSTPYTLEGFQTQYKDTLDGFRNVKVSEKTFRSVYVNQIYREKLLAEIAKDTPHTEEQVLARHILVDTAQEAIAIKQLLANGSDFAELAKAHSKDTGSGANGGNLAWSTKDAYVAEFGEAAFTQPIGEIGEPVKTEFGYHIIQVIARQELPVSASQYEQKQQKTFDDWLTKTREDAKTAGTLVTFDETWQGNVPPMPSSLGAQ